MIKTTSENNQQNNVLFEKEARDVNQELLSESESIQQKYGTKMQYDLDSLPFSFKEEDTTWADFGYTTLPLGIRRGRTQDFQFGKYTRFKAIFKDGKYQDLVSRAYALYPHEAVDEIVNDLAQKMDFTVHHTYGSHAGKAKYWEITSNSVQRAKVKGGFEEGDEIGVGAIIRNGIGTTYVALGADLFTYRVRCANGAIARGKDLGSIALAHQGDTEILKKRFVEGLEVIFENSKKLVDYYQQATQIKMNQRIAEKMAYHIPDKYLPGFIDVESIPDSNKLDVTLKDRSADLWRAFNDTTRKLWHSDTAGFSTTRYHEIYLHRILVSEVRRKNNPNDI